jgi:hypothetical protein
MEPAQASVQAILTYSALGSSVVPVKGEVSENPFAYFAFETSPEVVLVSELEQRPFSTASGWSEVVTV